MIDEDSLSYSGRALIRWKPPTGPLQEAAAEPSLLSRHLYLSKAFRMPKSYPRQRNYFGLYYFSQTRSHVWHESLNEANMMTFLDHTETVLEIASQPMEIVFADGRRHVPDLLALLGNHRQVVYDIKPESKIDSKVLAQFAKTQAVCRAVGWGYQVLTGLPEQVQINLTWLNYFKHPHFTPSSEAAALLLDALGQPITFIEAARLLSPHSHPAGRSSLLNLLWLRVVHTDMTQLLNDDTLIERNSDGHA